MFWSDDDVLILIPLFFLFSLSGGQRIHRGRQLCPSEKGLRTALVADGSQVFDGTQVRCWTRTDSIRGTRSYADPRGTGSLRAHRRTATGRVGDGKVHRASKNEPHYITHSHGRPCNLHLFSMLVVVVVTVVALVIKKEEEEKKEKEEEKQNKKANAIETKRLAGCMFPHLFLIFFFFSFFFFFAVYNECAFFRCPFPHGT